MQFDKLFHLVVLDVNYPICILMNIYENLKNNRKIIGEKNRQQRLEIGPCNSRPNSHTYDDFYRMSTARNFDPVIVDLSYIPMSISTGCQIVHLYCPQNLTHLDYVKLNGFHDFL